MNDAFRRQQQQLQQQRDRQQQQQRQLQQQQQRDRQQRERTRQLADESRRRERRRQDDEARQRLARAQQVAWQGSRSAPAGVPLAPPTPVVVAVIERTGPGGGGLEPLRLATGGVATVGADAGSLWRLTDAGVSAPHAEVRERAGRVEVCDLMSEQGTFVNGARTEGWTALGDGDELRFGPVVTHVQLAAAAPAPARGPARAPQPAAPSPLRRWWWVVPVVVGAAAGAVGLGIVVARGGGTPGDAPSGDPYACAVLAAPAQGPAVEAVQSRLDARGYHVALDGLFGPETAKAVADFQRDSGLPATGQVDGATRRELAAPCA